MASRGIVYDLHIIDTYNGLPYTLRIHFTHANTLLFKLRNKAIILNIYIKLLTIITINND